MKERTQMSDKKTEKERRKELRRRNKETKAEAKRFRRAQKMSGLRSRLGGIDLVVVTAVILFSLFGVAMVFSAGYYQTINTSNPNPLYYLMRQGIFVVTGWILMFAASGLDYHIYEKTGGAFLALSIILLVLVLVIGQNVNGAVRWINLGFIRITPSEFSKIFVIIFTASYLVRDPRNIRTLKGLAVLVAAMAAHFILIIRQPNLSTAIVIVMIMTAIMIVGGLNLFYLIVPAGAAVAGYFYIITYKTPYHWYQRLTSFMDPFAERQGDGYQVVQGLIALGNGGLKGLGFGKSISKNMYLPEPQNDFILAILGEELGYIGFLILMAAYIFLMFRLMMIALKAKDRLGFYLATGVSVMLGLQVVINVAVVTSSMPATGITLPFISYGGTSMWAFMIAMGIALSVSRRREPDAALSVSKSEGPDRKADE